MPEPKRPLKVFLSYASQDKPIVRELSRRLVGEGWIDTWQDEKNLLPGQDWRVKIEEAVEEADVVVIVLSQHSVSKEGHVQKELRYAREIALEKPEDTIFLIPLRLDECEVPRGLRFYQWVDYFEEKKDSSYKALIASLKLRYEQKIKGEEAERLRKEQQERERKAAEELAREKAEKVSSEKARLNAEEEEQRRVAKEKVEREAAEKFAREKAEKDAAEKARLKAEEEERQRIGKEKAKRDTEKEVKPIRVKPKAVGQFAYWFGGFIVLVLGIILLSSLNNPLSTTQPTPENTQTQAIATLAQDTIEPSATTTSISTSTPAITLTPTPLPTEITDAKGVSMVLIPSGEFTMGSERVAPLHIVYLDAFYIDKYEVTNALYGDCVKVGSCTVPFEKSSYNYDDYYGNAKFDNYPVIGVDWYQAGAYCEWRNINLPTEAQWEKAARGTDGRIYPWGNEISCNYANYYVCRGSANVVGSYESGKSPYGVYELAGNVKEWVQDWYSPNYYNISPESNPMGPQSGSWRVIRGGGYVFSNSDALRSDSRESQDPTNYYLNVGFRCARNVNP